MVRKEIRLSGTGGQGIILCGIILAEGGIYDGLQVVQSQSYGPEARGGASKAEVILSDEKIFYPKVIAPDCCLVMSLEAANLYAASVKPGGVLVVDSTMVPEIPESEAKIVAVPISQLARDTMGNIMTANIVALGALSAAAGLVTLKSLETAVANRLSKAAELNQRALCLGWQQIEERGLLDFQPEPLASGELVMADNHVKHSPYSDFRLINN